MNEYKVQTNNYCSYTNINIIPFSFKQNAYNFVKTFKF